MPATTRNDALDALRGILMLYVVFVIHGLFWLQLIPQAMASLMLFEMPAIFVVSGYAHYLATANQAGSDSGSKRLSAYWKLMFARLTRILVPYGVYSTACAAAIILDQSRHGDIAAWSILLAWANPVIHGDGHSAYMLNWHLWFVPVFLIVVAALPLAVRIRLGTRPGIPLLLAIGLLAIFLIGQFDFPGMHLLRQSFFYLLFALFGYHLARSPDYFRRARYLRIAFVSIVLLVVVTVFSGDLRVMDMQTNKFPPNHVFFIFSCLWMSLFLSAGFSYPGLLNRVAHLGRSWWLKPFVSAGYSIYLWQGLGYSLAIWVGSKGHLPGVAVWILALGLSVLLGLIAAPAEKIRFRSR